MQAEQQNKAAIAGAAAQESIDAALDKALQNTFPCSDPISLYVPCTTDTANDDDAEQNDHGNGSPDS